MFRQTALFQKGFLLFAVLAFFGSSPVLSRIRCVAFGAQSTYSPTCFHQKCMEKDKPTEPRTTPESWASHCLDEKAFFQAADLYLRFLGESRKPHAMLAVEIDNFRFFHLWHGKELGERYLAMIAECLLAILKDYDGVVGYFGRSEFALLLPCDRDQVQRLQKALAACRVLPAEFTGFSPLLGVYRIAPEDQIPEVMFDRAAIALDSVRGNFMTHVAEYDKTIDSIKDEEIQILQDIRRGFEAREFVFFLQLKCDMRSGKILGAEALVRWLQKEKGLIPPGKFIPILEKSGFTSMIDQFVWEEVFAWQRKWLDSGRKALPVSVNVSRTDLSSFDVAAFFTAMVKKYGVDPKLVEIEITESAYADNETSICDAINALKAAGFPMLMDDFGSGYSSLNMLRNISFDLLKFDMKFLRGSPESQQRGLDILESVLNMARLINVPVIMEGVETRDQVRFLVDMGCRYAQGYYYSRPMPVQEYENLIADPARVDYSGYQAKSVNQLHLRELMDATVVTDTMLNDLIGPAAFYDLVDDKILIKRVNAPYYRVFRSGAGEEVTLDHPRVMPEEYPKLLNLFQRAQDEAPLGAFGTFHHIRPDGQVLWVHLRLFFLREEKERRLFYGSLTDLTAILRREQPVSHTAASREELQRACEELHKSYTLLFHSYEKLRLSEEMYRVALGLTDHTITVIDIPNRTLNQIYNEGDWTGIATSMPNAPDSVIEAGVIHPDDCEGYKSFFNDVYSGVPKGQYTMRVREAKRGWVWFTMYYQTIFDQHSRPLRAIAFSDDITVEKQMEEKFEQYKNAVTADADMIWEVNLSQNLVLVEEESTFELFGGRHYNTYTELAETAFSLIQDPAQQEDMRRVLARDRLLAAFHSGVHEASVNFAFDFQDGRGQRWLRTTAYMTNNAAGDISLILCTRDITQIQDEAKALTRGADSDTLTGLYNHRAMALCVSRTLIGEQDETHALLIVDVDNFRQYNDTYGHLFGDAVLKSVAQALRVTFRSRDHLGRTGGDEFTVLMRHASQRAVVDRKVRQVRDKFSLLCQDLHIEVQLTLSVGIAFSCAGDDFEVLYERADQELGMNRQSGHNQRLARTTS